MANCYRYFTIAVDALPAEPDFEVWYHTWSRERPAKPSPDLLVVGITAGELPLGAELIGESSKEPPPPPPPPPPPARVSDAMREAFATWSALNRGL